MNRIAEVLVGVLSACIVLLAFLLVRARHRVEELETEVSRLKMEQRRAAPVSRNTAPTAAPEPTPHAPGSGPVGTQPEARAAVTHRDWAITQMTQEAQDEIEALTAAIGAGEELSRAIREQLHREIARWYDFMAQWWRREEDPQSPPFADPEYLAGLRRILDETDRAILPLLRDQQAQEYLRWRVRYEERFHGAPEEEPR